MSERIATHWPYVRAMADRMSQAKRLTDAELAAEYWQADYADVRFDREDEDLEPIPEILHRFATLPHYDEAPTHPTRTGTL